jgi:hypothetical protein
MKSVRFGKMCRLTLSRVMFATVVQGRHRDGQHHEQRNEKEGDRVHQALPAQAGIRGAVRMKIVSHYRRTAGRVYDQRRF